MTAANASHYVTCIHSTCCPRDDDDVGLATRRLVRLRPGMVAVVAAAAVVTPAVALVTSQDHRPLCTIFAAFPQTPKLTVLCYPFASEPQTKVINKCNPMLPGKARKVSLFCCCCCCQRNDIDVGGGADDVDVVVVAVLPSEARK